MRRFTPIWSRVASRPPAPAPASRRSTIRARSIGWSRSRREGVDATRNLADILRLAEATPARGRVQLTPRLARGLSYYTGAIMEVTVPDLAGSLGGGGRYDGLIGMFSGEQIPACGFSLGLERILVVMSERNMFPRTARDELAPTSWSRCSKESLSKTRCGWRRSCALPASAWTSIPEPDKLGKQFKYAGVARREIRHRRGRRRTWHGEVTLKNMETGQHTTVKRGALVNRIRELASP